MSVSPNRPGRALPGADQGSRVGGSRRGGSAVLSLRGSMVALVTPMKDGAVDDVALRALARWQIDKGTDGLVPCGTTGEGATLTAEEMSAVVRACVDEAKGRVPVVAGCGTNSTQRTIENV